MFLQFLRVSTTRWSLACAIEGTYEESLRLKKAARNFKGLFLRK